MGSLAASRFPRSVAASTAGSRCSFSRTPFQGSPGENCEVSDGAFRAREKWVPELTRRKYSTKRGSRKTMDRYSSVATTAILSMSFRHSGLGDSGGFIPCSSVAAVNRCSVLKQRCSSPKDCSMTSPCTVTLREPLMVSGG